MRDGKALARYGLDEAACELFARCEADRVHEDVELVPMPGKPVEHGIDFLIRTDIARKQQLRALAEALGQFFDAALQLVILVCERQFGTFTGKCLGDTCGNGTIACDADDQRPFTGHEAHMFFPCRNLAFWATLFNSIGG